MTATELISLTSFIILPLIIAFIAGRYKGKKQLIKDLNKCTCNGFFAEYDGIIHNPADNCKKHSPKWEYTRRKYNVK